MFTGIVEELGRVVALQRRDGHARLEVACPTVASDLGLGDSVAVAGCCLTVAALTRDGTEAAAAPGAPPGGAAGPGRSVGGGGAGRPTGFAADLMAETLAATGLGDLAAGDRVNLERALRPDARLGGHLVQGHVDAVGEVVDREEQPGTVWLTITTGPAVARYLVAKGSVTVDGASLTVVDVVDDDPPRFRIALIPHTLAVTTFGDRRVGDRVNLEVDVVAKYVERLLAAGTATPYDARPKERR